MTAKELIMLAEIFPTATFESSDGIAIFDKNGTFIANYFNGGFFMDKSYKHYEQVKNRLIEHGHEPACNSIREAIKLEQLLSGND